jgi:hypothetical protein
MSMPSLFDLDYLCDENKCKNHKNKCTGCICQLLKEYASSKEDHPYFLIVNKGTSQPISLDGSNTPTQFTLESFDPKTCCAVFSFEDILDTSPLITVRRCFTENCHEIAGIVCLGNDPYDYI